MNTNDLKIFEAVATSKSFTKAASVMFTVQSNVTARIKSLEDEFGTELFSRSSRKVELTSAGHALMPFVKQIGRLVAEARNSLLSADQVSGSLKVGCIETTLALKVPGMLSSFSEKYPDVDLEFKSQMRNVLIDQVVNMDLDAAFVSAPVNIKGLDQIKIKEEQLVIITSSNGVDLSELLNSQPLKTVVFGEGCIFRTRLESYLSSKGIVHYKSTVVNSIEGIINFVEAGLGISIFPEELISEYYASRAIKSYNLNRQLGTMNTVLVFRKDEQQSKALKEFIKMYS